MVWYDWNLQNLKKKTENWHGFLRIFPLLGVFRMFGRSSRECHLFAIQLVERRPPPIHGIHSRRNSFESHSHENGFACGNLQWNIQVPKLPKVGSGLNFLGSFFGGGRNFQAFLLLGNLVSKTPGNLLGKSVQKKCHKVGGSSLGFAGSLMPGKSEPNISSRMVVYTPEV